MSAKRQKTPPEPKKRVGLNAVSRGCKSFTTPLRVLNTLKGPKQAREWLILSLSEMGQELAKYRGKPIPKSSISLWDRGLRSMPLEVVSAYADLISDKLSSIIGRRVEVMIEVNSPWRVSAYTLCACGQLFRMHDAKSRHCPGCVRRR